MRVKCLFLKTFRAGLGASQSGGIGEVIGLGTVSEADLGRSVLIVA